MIQSRLQRAAGIFSVRVYIYYRDCKNGNCDALSRWPIADSTPVFETEYTSINYIRNGLPTMDCKILQHETSKDVELCKIVDYIQTEWPKNSNELSTAEKNFFIKGSS